MILLLLLALPQAWADEPADERLRMQEIRDLRERQIQMAGLELGLPAQAVLEARAAAGESRACAAEMVPITKALDGSAACVYPESFERLVARGWGY